MKVLLTSGGTKVMIDEVRNIGNMSNGTFGDHICRALLATGHNVDFLYAKGSKAPHEFRADLRKNSDPLCDLEDLVKRVKFLKTVGTRYTPTEYYDFNAYRNKFLDMLGTFPEVVILAAAVSDFAPVVQAAGKIDSNTKRVIIEMEQTPKIIRMVKELCPKCFLVGFKLLVGSTQSELEEAMRHQIEKAGSDMVVGNDIRDIRGNNHKLTLMYKGGKVEYINNHPGTTLAEILVQRIQCAMTKRATENAGNPEAEL
jgi:phosphopantothenoylcysteine synthetase/decarboxylase